MRRYWLLPAAALALLAPAAAQAHHSFAAFFDANSLSRSRAPSRPSGSPTRTARFAFDVTGADGKVVHWRAETNAPVVLVRRGWNRDILKPGEVITIEGWMSRDGKPYIRLRQAFDAKAD